MAKIKFNLNPATLERIEGKFTATPLSNGSMSLEDIAEIVAEGRPAIDKADVVLAVTALTAEITRLLGLGYTVTTPIGWFSPNISGSVPNMDSPLTAENEFGVVFTVSGSTNAKLANVKPVRDAKSDPVHIDWVEDATKKTKGVLKRTNPILVSGFGLSLTQTEEKMELLAADGTVASSFTYDSQGSTPPIKLKAALATQVPAGKYTLRVTTRGYNNPTADAVAYAKPLVVTE